MASISLKIGVSVILNVIALYLLFIAGWEGLSKKEEFHKLSKLEICANMKYPECEHYLVKDCERHKRCTKYEKRRDKHGELHTTSHCLKHKKYYICEDAKGFDPKEGGKLGYNRVCTNCKPHPRSYEFDLQFECDEHCDEWDTKHEHKFLSYPKSFCRERIYHQCMKGGENYAYVPHPADYLCKVNKEHQFEEPQFGATAFQDPENVRNIFHYWGTTLWYAFDLAFYLSLIIFVFLAIPFEFLWPKKVLQHPNKHMKGGTLAIYAPIFSLFFSIVGSTAFLLIVFTNLSLKFDECIELQYPEHLFAYITWISVLFHLLGAIASFFAIITLCKCKGVNNIARIVVLLGLLVQILGIFILAHIYHTSHDLDTIGRKYATYFLVCLIKCGVAIYMWWPNTVEYQLIKKQQSYKVPQPMPGQPIPQPMPGQYVPQPVPSHEKIY